MERGEVKMKVVPHIAEKRSGTLVELKVKKGNNRNRSELAADWQTVRGQSGNKQFEGKPPTYPARARCVGCEGELKR